MKKRFSSKIFLIIIVLLILGVIWMLVLPKEIKNQEDKSIPTPHVSVTPNHTTMEGTIVCLPHRDTSGPQTLECAIGIQVDSGEYYSLDMGRMSQTPPDYTNGQRVKANGVVTPIEALSSDHWQKYDVVGIFSPTDSFEVIK